MKKQAKLGMGGSGPAIAGGNQEVIEIDYRRMAHGKVDPRFQASWPEKNVNSENRHRQVPQNPADEPAEKLLERIKAKKVFKK